MTRLGGHGLDHVFHTVRTDFLQVVRSWTDSTGPDDAGAAGVVELGDPTGERPGRVVAAVGEPRRVADLLATVTPQDVVRGATVTRGAGVLAAPTLSAWGLRPATTWDRMVTETAPVVPDLGAAAVVPLDLDRDADEIEAVLAEANPSTRHGVRGRHARRARWYGVRMRSAGEGYRTGALVAAGSATPVPGGAVHLGSIGTLPAFRGRGYAGALTARMTADGVAGHGLVTLGLYADNLAARRVYERLGFVVAHRVETWQPV
ncbi:GNAT family N-acetyltransferase [Promicromonospora sp. MS192]|uniref:GNAT family N-acetyltransferase n=1 Tax=Promicromonospora sp. MS192 TaxID=3412684 RepID=UPI003C2D3B0A